MALDASPPAVVPVTSPAGPDGANGWFHSPVALTWNVADAGSPAVTTNCGPQTVATDAVVAFTCTAESAGGTTNQPVTIKRDATPPSAPTFSGIGSGAKLKKLPAKSRISCTATDATSGLSSCVVTGYSRKPGRHTLTATATDESGLTSTSTLTYNFRPPAASKLAIPKRQSLASVRSSGLRCTLRTAERRTKLTAVLKSGSTILGRKAAKSKRAGRMTLKIPLAAAGVAQLRGAASARLSVTLTADSRHTTRAKLRAKRTLSR